jgi:hypothetical protein
MRTISPDEVRDALALSGILHLTLDVLHQSPLAVHANDLSVTLGLYPSELSRMKWLHQRPQYSRLVCRKTLRRVVNGLFRQFPALVLWQLKDGGYRVTFRKTCKTPATDAIATRIEQGYRKIPKPGSTRWFLQQEGL